MNSISITVTVSPDSLRPRASRPGEPAVPLFTAERFRAELGKAAPITSLEQGTPKKDGPGAGEVQVSAMLSTTKTPGAIPEIVRQAFAVSAKFGARVTAMAGR